MVYTWPDFKAEFMIYIRNTPGLFTLLEDTSFPSFDLDAFLTRQHRAFTRLTTTQIEMLMSLGCFIDIHEGLGHVTMDTFPALHRLQLKTLIQQNLVQLHPCSLVKRGCISYMTVTMGGICSAAAA
jgi:hypothetical protein